MPVYFRPGVFIEETLTPLSDVQTDAADAEAAFVGKTSAGGPVGPIRVNSWPQFQALFGPISYDTEDLSYAVYTFFQNGGSGCYVVRALPSDATAATRRLFDGTGVVVGVNDVLIMTASAPGKWASDAASPSRVFLTVTPSGTGTGRFDLKVEVGNNTYLAAQENFVDLSMDPGDPRYALDVINSPVVGSQYVTAGKATSFTFNPETPVGPAAVTKTPLTGGTDGVAAPALFTAVQRLDAVDRNLVINVPGAADSVVSDVVNWAAASGRHFVVADAPKPAANSTAADSVTALTNFVTALPDSSHLAVYGPWIWIADPASRAGAMRLTAPGGAVVAHYLRTDSARGVHKAPAGVTTLISGAIKPYVFFTNAQKDALAATNINLLLTAPGLGVVIWGARTQANSTPDRYVPVRRLLIALKTELNELTRFAVFEGNDEELRSTVEQVVEQYLQSQFDLGAFKGDTPDEAFYVRCDDTNNPPSTVDAGVINIDIGVALKSPAEFIVIRLGQQQSGSVATDSLEEV